MKKKDYLIVTFAIFMLAGGIYLWFDEELLSKIPLKTWIFEIALFLGFLYSLIFGTGIQNRTLKWIISGLSAFLLFLFLIVLYSILKIIAPGFIPF